MHTIVREVFSKVLSWRRQRWSCSNFSALASNETRRRVLSGLQPTGNIHLGNYFGAIVQWRDLQNIKSYENYYCVVDQHAITTFQDPKLLSEHTLNSAAMYIACGIDPDKSTIFIQSHVRAHTELAWYLTCNTPLSWLNRMVQFKEKSKQRGDDNVSLGLYAYPVLMAADILLYDAHYVPVGEDQTQHIELTKDICQRFNSLYGKKIIDKKNKKEIIEPVLQEPSILLMQGCARVMSLKDGTSKMSKSDDNDMCRINLLDPPDLILKKIKQCKTDSILGLSVDDDSRPECRNLTQLYLAIARSSVNNSSRSGGNGGGGYITSNSDSNSSKSSNGDSNSGSNQGAVNEEEIISELRNMSWGAFKPRLAEALIEHIKPIQDTYKRVIDDKSHLQSVLNKGRLRAELTAEATLKRTREALGIYSS